MLTGSSYWHRALHHWVCRFLIAAFLIAPLGFVPQVAQAASCGGLTDVTVPYTSIVGNVTWLTNHVYILHNGVTVPVSSTLTIQAGAIVKFDLNTWLDVFGTLNLTSTVGNPVRFTSLRDDDPNFGCDTNNDGNGTTPALGDWDSVYIEPNSTLSGNGVLRYSRGGVNFYHNGSGDMAQAVTGWVFEKNCFGLSLNLLGSGNITASITNNTFQQNWVGLFVAGHGGWQIPNPPLYCPGSGSFVTGSGQVLSNLSGNTFSSQLTFPIYLHATAFPTYGANTFTNDVYHAIALGGEFAHGGTLPFVNGGADTGSANFPYVVFDNLFVNAGVNITVPADMVIKAAGHLVNQVWVGYYIDVIGTLTLQGTPTHRVIFTSFWDDTYGGDANGDGGATVGNPGDWGQIYLENTGTNFTNTLVRFSTEGVEPYNSANAAIAPPITNNIIEKNSYSGVFMVARSGSGDIDSVVSNNQISDSPYGLVISITQSATVSPTISGNTFERHSSAATYLENTNGFIGGTLSNNQFNDSSNGAWLYLFGSGDINPVLAGNTFYSNTTGLRTSVLTHFNGNGQLDLLAAGASRPSLSNNNFNISRSYPIYLGGSAWPTYSNNTFSNSHYTAIGLAGYFANTGGYWPIVPGDGGQSFPYVVADNVNLIASGAVTLQPGAVVKFGLTKELVAGSAFQFNGTPGNSTIFTSIKDDSILGDTGADGPTTGAKNDWKDLYLYDDLWHNLSYFTLSYSKFGLSTEADFAENTNDCPTISHALFHDNGYGVAALANLNPNENSCPSVNTSTFQNNTFGFGSMIWDAGNDLSVITSSQFSFNTYAVFVDARDWPLTVSAAAPAGTPQGPPSLIGAGRANRQPRPSAPRTKAPAATAPTVVIPPATGVSVPTVTGNTFSNNYFPLYMGGTGFPAWSGNTYGPYVHRGIRLGGTFNNSRPGNDVYTLPQIDDGTGLILPYAVTNDPVPCTVDGHCTKAYWLVQYDATQAHGATVSVLPGTVFKVDTTNEIDIAGELDLQGVANSSIIFTSYRDDGVLGDTNADGITTSPARGDWGGVYLLSSGVRFNYVFDYALVKYATDGISIWTSGSDNLFPVIAHNTLVQNVYGVNFIQHASGNIIDPHDAIGHFLGPLVHDNYFSGNNEHIHISAPSSTGRTLATLTNNCLLPTATYGIDNLSALNVVTGTLNWWGAASGPNPPGQGLPVSSNVLVNPWLTSAPVSCQTTLNGIQGRTAQPGDTPQSPNPLPGVTVLLSTGGTAQTNQNGNFSFGNLAAGQYQVTPVLNGYMFTPPSLSVNLPPSATGLAFSGSPVVGQTYSIRGRVVDRANHAVPAVTVLSLSTTQSGLGTTDASGYYTVTSLLAGTYTITPFLAGYQFLPASRQVVVAGNVSGQDFIRRNLGETNFFLNLPLVER